VKITILKSYLDHIVYTLPRHTAGSGDIIQITNDDIIDVMIRGTAMIRGFVVNFLLIGGSQLSNPYSKRVFPLTRTITDSYP